MLIEVKTKVARIIDSKTKKFTETYVMDEEFFANAEYRVTQLLNTHVSIGIVESFEIQSLRISPIKEIDDQTLYNSIPSFIASLRDIFHDDNGNEKQLRYKVLLWAENITNANRRIQELSRQGYDMLVESIKEVNYIYLNTQEDNDEQ